VRTPEQRFGCVDRSGGDELADARAGDDAAHVTVQRFRAGFEPELPAQAAQSRKVAAAAAPEPEVFSDDDPAGAQRLLQQPRRKLGRSGRCELARERLDHDREPRRQAREQLDLALQRRQDR
jgi:hypothetical protein